MSDFHRRLLRPAIRQLQCIAGLNEPIDLDSPIVAEFITLFNDELKQSERDEMREAVSSEVVEVKR